MLIAFLILVGIILLLLIIPLGAEIASENGVRQLKIVIAGIRIGITPKSKEALSSESKSPVAETGEYDMLERLGALRESSLRIWEFYEGELPSKLWMILKRYYRALHFRVHRFDICIGYQDPALTGTVYGAACAMAEIVPDHIPLRLTPDFETGHSSFDYRISLAFIPARVLFEIVRTIFSLRLWAVQRVIRAAESPARQTRRQHV